MSDLSQAAIQREIEAKKKKLEDLKLRRAARLNQPETKFDVGTNSNAQNSVRKDEAPTDVLKSVDSLIGSAPITSTQPNSVQSSLFTPSTSVSKTNGVVQLSIQSLPGININSVERIVYDQSIQTDPPPMDQQNDIARVKEMQEKLEEERARLKQKEDEYEDLVRELKAKSGEDKETKKRKDLTLNEKQTILASQPFQSFFQRATILMERALGQSERIGYDYLVNYNDDAEARSVNIQEKVVHKYTFIEPTKTVNRPVTNLNWSSKYKELLLSSYAGLEDEMSTEPDGCVLIWNLHMTSRPEYYFYCQSAVLSACFHPDNHKHIIAGTQSGQVVVWDTREKSTPVNRTSLSHGHTHPIFSLQVIRPPSGDYQIVSVSTDGHVCVWSDHNLHRPLHEASLKLGKDELTTTTFDIPARDEKSMVLGSDEGKVYKARIFEQKEHIYEDIQAHDAPITSVEFHPLYKSSQSVGSVPGSQGNNLSDLYLTSSYDWTVKLWHNKVSVKKPLFTMESARDYVYDVKWSPKHPAMFASGDGTGRLDFWNLNQDTEVPVHTLNVSQKGERKDTSTITEGSEVDGPGITGPSAISKLRWSDDGSMIAVGTSLGGVHVYELQGDFGVPGKDDATIFYEKVNKKALNPTL